MSETNGQPPIAERLTGAPRPDWVSPCGTVVLYCGDAEKLVAQIPASVESIVTDPVWPNCPEGFLHGSDRPQALLAWTLCRAPLVERVVIHMGVDSDPRFLQAVPSKYPFLRVCWLRYARPSYKGRILIGSEVGYVFGQHAPSSAYRVAPGEVVNTHNDREHLRRTGDGDKTIDYNGRHPCPRQTMLVEWLVKWYGGQSVLDPFMGSATTALAAVRRNRQFIGVEIDPEYFAIAVKRIEEELNRHPLFTPPAPRQGALFEEEAPTDGRVRGE